ncbi:hypothetical protein EV714DRAFT_217140 [Schizophyllum commune]
MRNFEAREDERWYWIRALDVFAASDTSFLREGPIIASRLVSLTLTANVIKAKTQQQLAALATKLVTPHLNELKILRPVPSAKDYERSMFDFLEATKSLQHVTICWSFVYKAGLRQYLQSDAAKHLVSLRLEASGTSKITDALWRGLCGEQHNLPELQQLTLRKIPDLTPKALWCILRTRHASGCTRPLLVEWEGCEIPPSIANEARELEIYIEKY